MKHKSRGAFGAVTNVHFIAIVLFLVIAVIATGAHAKTNYKFISDPFVMSRGDGDTVGAKGFTLDEGGKSGLIAQPQYSGPDIQRTTRRDRMPERGVTFRWVILYLFFR